MPALLGLVALASLGSAALLGRWTAGYLALPLAAEAREVAEQLEALRAEPAEVAGAAGTSGVELESLGPGTEVASPPRRGRRFAPAPPQAGIAVGSAEVRSWARAQSVPRGRERAADAALPAGLEVEGAQEFVAALEPGDRLVAIDGAPATSHEEAVQRVLEARRRGQKSITASFVRWTARGAVRFAVVVEQPYDGF